VGSVLSVYWLETTYTSVVIAIVVLTMRKAARGFYRTRVHAGPKRSDELLPGAQWLERPVPPHPRSLWAPGTRRRLLSYARVPAGYDGATIRVAASAIAGDRARLAQ